MMNVIIEFKKIFNHRGIDWCVVWVVFSHNLDSEDKIGASTIMMQIARKFFLAKSDRI